MPQQATPATHCRLQMIWSLRCSQQGCHRVSTEVNHHCLLIQSFPAFDRVLDGTATPPLPVLVEARKWDPNPPHAEGGLYIVYYYRGTKVVQSILDTYPMGFPAAAAQQQVDRVIGALLAMGPEEEALSDLLLPYPLVMSELAVAGLHDVAVDRFSEFVSVLQEQDLRHGAMLEVLAAVAGDEPDVSEYLSRDTEFDPEFATPRQARAIITTARRQGLDSVKLSKLASAMGHEAEELGVTPPSTDYTTVNILLGEARAAGLPHEAIDRIYQAIDPDGYEEERYEQAVDLLEFGDAAADGALDGLPHFDGEFSR